VLDGRALPPRVGHLADGVPFHRQVARREAVRPPAFDKAADAPPAR
jgi:hypothetical protein